MAIQSIINIRGGGQVRDYQGGGLRRPSRAANATLRKRAEESALASEKLMQSTIDALSAYIAILDETGDIIAVNEPWLRFAGENGFIGAGHGIGTNYLEVCESVIGTSCDDSRSVAEGVRSIMEGRAKDFRIVYCCNSLQEKRWFRLHATRFFDKGTLRLIMAHENITEIKHAEEELRGISEHVLRLQDEERRRIARDLHDVTAQNIFAMTMNLARLKKISPFLTGRPQELIAETLRLGEESLQEIRTVSYVLHPPTVRGQGLVSALRSYIAGFVKRTGIDVTLVARPQRVKLSAEVQTALFRIVQESLGNIIRHSGSKTARIHFRRRSDTVLLEVKDEGTGIPIEILDESSSQSRSLGVGIPGMRTRLRQLGGKLTIKSDARGTTVTATVPVHAG